MNERSDNFTNPLPQKVDYNLEDHLIYGKQKAWKKVVEWILTILGWALMLSYLSYILYGTLAIRNGWELPEIGIYNRQMVLTIQKYFFILFCVLLIITILMILWKNYNLRRFGKLHRRTFRPPVSNEELSEIFEIDKDIIDDIQKTRVVVLRKNIIPDDLGMGEKKKE